MALIGFSVIRKDLKVYVRHRKTLLLVFFAPILIMVLIGSVFSGASGGSFKDVRLGIGGGSEQGEQIIKELNSSGMFVIIKENTTDPVIIKEGVGKGKYSAGIFIPEDERQPLKLFLDNSKLLISPVISTSFISTIEELSDEFTFGFISKLWKNLAQIETKLKLLKEGILLKNERIADLNRDSQNALVSLDRINVSALNESTVEMKNTLDLMKADLSRTSIDINVKRRELRELDNNVNSIFVDSAALRDDLRFVIDNIESVDAALLAIQTDLKTRFNATCADPFTPGCTSIANTIMQIQDTRVLMLERTQHVRSLYNGLSNIAQKSAELHEKLNTIDIMLQNMQTSIASYTLEISNTQGKIADMQNAVLAFGTVKDKSSAISMQMDALASEMANSTSSLVSDIDGTGEVLGEVTATPPAVIATPIKLERNAVFNNRSYLDFLMPGIISIVLMLVSFLLASITIVQERTKKTLIRTMMTPLSLEEFILAKTAVLVLIATLQGIIIVIVAFVLYRAVVPFNQLEQLFLIILVYSAAFIGIGMALAAFAESENTAMLMSLVLSIPMLFLSGVFFPFESMPELMSMLGSSLPITMGIKALGSVLIYQKGFDAIEGYLLPLLVYGIVGLSLAYLLMKREVTD